jgi:endonuclease/exonuclease/phosphatase family metal-dependent hydrolase
VRDRVVLLTFNLLTRVSADGPARHEVVKRVLSDLKPDVVALQEVTRNQEFDQAAELLGEEFTIVDVPGGSPDYGGECLATCRPVLRVDTLDQPLGADASKHRGTAAALEFIAPGHLGPLVVVHHKGTYELHLEHIRERQALATALFVDELVRDRPNLPVMLLGDFNAAPDTASVRFLTGRQSVRGWSVRYEDAWEAVHGNEPGHTFDPKNPLVRAGEMPLERGRRIDYIMTRSGPHGALLDVADCQLVFTEAVDGVWASDHYGLLAELRRPAHPPGQWA